MTILKSPFAALVSVSFCISAGPANASVTVFGEGPAETCYVAARDSASGPTALRACDEALETGQLSARDRAATFVNRGVLHLQRRDGASALADFDAAIALGPQIGEAHVNRGAALILLNRPAEAIADISRGLDLGTQEPHEAHFNRAVAHEMEDDLPAAYNDYRRAQALAPAWGPPQVELARFTVERR